MPRWKHERGMLGDPSQSANLLHQVTELLTSETVDGVRLIDSPLYRDRLMRLQARVAADAVARHAAADQHPQERVELMPILVVKLIGAPTSTRTSAHWRSMPSASWAFSTTRANTCVQWACGRAATCSASA